MPTVLFNNGKVAFESGKVVFVPDGSVAADCTCCGDDPCPEKKVCDPEEAPTYPVRAGIKMTVTGIENTWTGTWTNVQCIGPQSNGEGCCSKATLNNVVEWELNGFAALNQVYQGAPPSPEDNCDNVCFPCTLSIKIPPVKITGTVTETYTATYVDNGDISCPDEEPQTFSLESNVCGLAGLVFNHTTNTITVTILCLEYDYNGVDNPGLGVGVRFPYYLGHWATNSSTCDADIVLTGWYCSDPLLDYTDCLSYTPIFLGTVPTELQVASFVCPENMSIEFYTPLAWPACDNYEYSSTVVPECTLTGQSNCADSNPSGGLGGNSWAYKHIQTSAFGNSMAAALELYAVVGP